MLVRHQANLSATAVTSYRIFSPKWRESVTIDYCMGGLRFIPRMLEIPTGREHMNV